ncbi:PilZ domain-containing protein [Rhizorhapis suberifaciens]|uniref:PilZ domain-containing protein n=1 Tax=Rhizorhapis suberifaciens TaxID=13656 RepID=UPI00160A5FB2
MGLRLSRYRRVEPALVEHRGALRHPVILQRASIRHHADHGHDAQLLDLSIYGCRIATEARFDADDRVWLRFEGSRPVAATTVWSDGGSIGCRFDAPIDRALFRRLSRAND